MPKSALGGLKILHLSYFQVFGCRDMTYQYLNDQLKKRNKLRLAYSNHRKGNQVDCIHVLLLNDASSILRTKLDEIKVVNFKKLASNNSLLSPRSTGPLRLLSSATI